MKNKLRNSLFLVIFALAGLYFFNFSDKNIETTELQADVTVKTKKKTQEERMLFSEERERHEFNMQKNPTTGEIPIEEKEKEFLKSLEAKEAKKNGSTRVTTSAYVSRGPSNFGGRTRALVVDITNSNVILAGGVSSGLFKTTNGGTSWTKVSANDEIHNVTALAQDPTSTNIWYYATGEIFGNSASLGSAFRGRGVWKSTDSGDTWNQISDTDSIYELFDSDFDYINALAVSPITGDLFIGAFSGIYRFNGTTLSSEITASSGTNRGWTDVAINSAGVVYASIEGTTPENGIWASTTGTAPWKRIAQNGTPASWNATGRIMLATAPSNNNIIYALFMNSGAGTFDADLWHYNNNGGGLGTWTDYSSKLPDAAGSDLAGNDPFTAQGGYDLVVSVKPDNEDFVLIGGTNAYKIEDIVNDAEFERIGGYANHLSYALYPNHHPDIHVLEFDPSNSNILFSGTDGGVHKTTNITNSTIAWTSLNNNYQTYQYYHVAMDDTNGSNAVIGGAQDNGTTIGGSDIGEGATTMSSYYGGDGVAVGITRRNSGANYQLYYGSQSGNIRTNYPGFREIIPAGSSSQFVTYFYLDPASTNALYYAGLTTLYMTTNAESVTTAIDASNWINMGSVSPSQSLRSFATSWGTYSSSSYLLIGGENGGIFRLDDPQNKTNLTTVINVTPSGASTAFGSVVSGLAVHPTNPDIAMAVYANYGINSIFVTSNATAGSPTWTLVEQNLNAHSIRSAAIAEVGAETIYFVGTARGLYSSNDPTTKDWDIEGQNEIGFAVVSGLVYRPSDSKLLVGTHGNGMYETTVENTLSVNSYTQVGNKISIYPNPAQSEINFKSNNYNFSDNTNYRIIDISGKVVSSGTINNKKVDVSRLNAGLYFVSINANGLKETLKFVKK